MAVANTINGPVNIPAIGMPNPSATPATPTSSIYNTSTSLSNGGDAQGDAPTSQATQGLINSELNKAYGNDTNSLMQGVASSANGLLQNTPTGAGLGGGTNQDFEDTLSRANASAVGNQASSIQSYLNATQPIRQAQYEQDAAGNLAKISQLDMNDYMLYNQQQLQQLQLQQAQAAASSSFLGSLLGLGGMVVGAGVAALIPGAGVAGIAGAALAGGQLGSGTGKAVAGSGSSTPTGPSR